MITNPFSKEEGFFLAYFLYLLKFNKMSKYLLSLLFGLLAMPLFLAQNVNVFTNVPFYSMYHFLGEGETLPPEAYTEIPAGAIRMHGYERDIISRKLSDAEIASLGSELTLNVILIAACDNYDRIAGVNLALVPKGLSTYTWETTEVKRIEIARFITPFMNKNVSPTSVPYSYRVDNISRIIHDPVIMAAYDAWIEFRADGYSAAAQQQVSGCAGRTDVFRGNLDIVSSGTPSAIGNFFMPLSHRANLNNYNSTDVPGQTVRIINFTLPEAVDNLTLHLITSNHGANSGGEEYVRRNHYVYLDNQLIHQYKPGGKTCEPYRQYNTQGNGIYGSSPQTLRSWMSWNNWCPGDAVPNREIDLGNLAAGNHTIRLEVPEAVFNGGQGYIPVSMYLQNSKSGEVICKQPSDFAVTSQVGNVVQLGWQEQGSTQDWQIVWGRKNSYTPTFESYHDITGTPTFTKGDLTQYWSYEAYVKSKCTSDLHSLWTGPVFTQPIQLATAETDTSGISLYPNPATDVVFLKNVSEKTTYEIVSVNAQVAAKGNVGNGQINIKKLPKGVYFISLDDNGKTAKMKLIKN